MERGLTALSPLKPTPYDGSATFGLRLLLISLSVLFVGGIVGLFFAPGRTEPLRTILPPELWLSTACLVAGGLALRFSLQRIRRNERRAFRFLLAGGLACGIAFVAVQTPALGKLLGRHAAITAAIDAAVAADPLATLPGGALNAALDAARGVGTVPGAGAMPGLLFFLILLHALHVGAGLAALGWVTFRAFAEERGYNADYHTPVRYTVMYWGFLEMVWLVMLATFWLI